MKKGVTVNFVSSVIGVTLGLLSPVAYGRAIDLVEPTKVLINCELGAERMVEAIIRGGGVRKWFAVSQGPGVVELQYIKGNNKHIINVNVQYTANTFAVTYKDSVNLNYSKTSDGQQMLHPRSVGWMKNLSGDIRLATSDDCASNDSGESNNAQLDTQKSITTQSNSTDVKSLYSANNDDEIYQYLGRSSSDIKEQLELRYHNDCTLRSGEFSFCDTTFLYRSKQSEFSVETRQVGGVTVQRTHGFQGENYAGLKVHISGASKFLLAAIDQQVRQVKTQRLDLQVLLETPKPGEVILWFGHDLKTLDDILFDHAKPAES
ncbi:hypothetical protein N9444_05085 [Gammaproteobacteria bacterium]|nr:hypothetical protein [Gammaproteobacteria bacterium]